MESAMVQRCDLWLYLGSLLPLPGGQEWLAAAVHGWVVGGQTQGHGSPEIAPLRNFLAALTRHWPVSFLQMGASQLVRLVFLGGSRPGSDLVIVPAFLKNKQILRKEYSFYLLTFIWKILIL